ncbi:MAG: sigma-70 family RNA polymerase sigma factor [Pyrinomonadaceae bacterium]
MDLTDQMAVALQQQSDDDKSALSDLMPVVYDELRRQASRFLRNERSGHTLQTTALIHETYLKLIDQRQVNSMNRAQFFAISARLMRRILVDHARAKCREKRGGGAIVLSINDANVICSGEAQDTDLVALDTALNRLALIDEQQARIVELKYFSGLTLEETADAMKLSRTTVATDWSMARAWLFRELTR